MKVNVSSQTPRPKVFSAKDMAERTNFLDQRSVALTDQRIEELEMKVNMHYTKNRYLPYEMRLKKLRDRFYKLKKKKDASKEKILALKKKIKACESILSEAKKMSIKNS
ncbi:MAG: hypothetical protein NDI94_03550 [Candidatus Woesearchaeota archaeon]|nr:hypothetical protein [Candidatus Woesearchaeota archaeon]